MNQHQEQLRRRVSEIETHPTGRIVTNDSIKEVTFDGRDGYPIEFLKELKEIKELYYETDDVKWVGRHLTDQAVTWRRIIKNDITTFESFEERFMEKFWGAHVQEKIRDRLEYGKFPPNQRCTAVQYMERQILQARQLIPPISDHHLIKKLARHYTKEVEIAVLTRGIKDIHQFEVLLQEYTTINENDERIKRSFGPNVAVKNEENNMADNGYNHQLKGKFTKQTYNRWRSENQVVAGTIKTCSQVNRQKTW